MCQFVLSVQSYITGRGLLKAVCCDKYRQLAAEEYQDASGATVALLFLVLF